MRKKRIALTESLSSRLCVRIITTPKVITTQSGRKTSADSTIIAAAQRAQHEEQGDAEIEVELQSQAAQRNQFNEDEPQAAREEKPRQLGLGLAASEDRRRSRSAERKPARRSA